MGAACIKRGHQRRLVIVPPKPQPTLEETLRDLTRKVDTMTRRMENAFQASTICKGRGDKAGAIRQLRIRQACRAAVDRLNDLKTTLVVSDTQRMTVEGMEAATQVMNQVDPDKVHAAFDANAEAMETLRGVTDAMNAAADDDVDAELELEFEALQTDVLLPRAPTEDVWTPGEPTHQVGPRRRGGFQRLEPVST